MTHCSVESPTHQSPNIISTIHSRKGPGHFIIVFYNEPHVDFVTEEIEHTDSAAIHILPHTHASPPPSARDAQIPLPFHLEPMHDVEFPGVVHLLTMYSVILTVQALVVLPLKSSKRYRNVAPMKARSHPFYPQKTWRN